jgi:hypothetical protein
MTVHQPRVVIALAIACLGTCMSFGAEPSPARPSRRYTIEQFMDTEKVSGNSFSADETKILFSSDRTGIFNAFTIPIAGGGAEPVTRSKLESTFGVACFPKDQRILFTHDQGGNENSHLYVIQRETELEMKSDTNSAISRTTVAASRFPRPRQWLTATFFSGVSRSGR